MAYVREQWAWYGWYEEFDIGAGRQIKRKFDPFHRRGGRGFRIGWQPRDF